jgi:hypothetical protein
MKQSADSILALLSIKSSGFSLVSFFFFFLMIPSGYLIFFHHSTHGEMLVGFLCVIMQPLNAKENLGQDFTSFYF